MEYVRLDFLTVAFNGYENVVSLYRVDRVYRVYVSDALVVERESEITPEEFRSLCDMFKYAFSEGYGCGETDEYFRHT